MIGGSFLIYTSTTYATGGAIQTSARSHDWDHLSWGPTPPLNPELRVRSYPLQSENTAAAWQKISQASLGRVVVVFYFRLSQGAKEKKSVFSTASHLQRNIVVKAEIRQRRQFGTSRNIARDRAQVESERGWEWARWEGVEEGCRLSLQPFPSRRFHHTDLGHARRSTGLRPAARLLGR